MQNMATAIYHKFNFINQRNELHRLKEQEKLVTQLSFRAVGQNHAEWQTFEEYEIKRQLYGSAVHPSLTIIQIRDKCMAVQSTQALLSYK